MLMPGTRKLWVKEAREIRGEYGLHSTCPNYTPRYRIWEVIGASQNVNEYRFILGMLRHS